MIFNMIGNFLAFMALVGVACLIAKSDPVREFIFIILAITVFIVLPIKLISLLMAGSVSAFILILPLQILLGVLTYACFNYLKQYRKHNKYRWWKDLGLF